MFKPARRLTMTGSAILFACSLTLLGCGMPGPLGADPGSTDVVGQRQDRGALTLNFQQGYQTYATKADIKQLRVTLSGGPLSSPLTQTAAYPVSANVSFPSIPQGTISLKVDCLDSSGSVIGTTTKTGVAIVAGQLTSVAVQIKLDPTQVDPGTGLVGVGIVIDDGDIVTTPLPTPAPTTAPTTAPTAAPTPTPAPTTAPNSSIPALPSGLKTITVSMGSTPGANLQKAIDSLASTGGIINIPAGTYNMETQVYLKSNIHLVGVQGQTILKGAGSRTILDAPGCTDVSIRNLVLDANENGNLQRAFVSTNTTKLGIYNCEIKNTATNAYGIELQKNVDQAKIIGNYIHDIGNTGDTWGTAITLGWDSSDATITDNRINNCTRAGINAHDSCKNLYVARNDVRNLQGEGLGIELWSQCSGTVEYNLVSSWISFDGASGTIQYNEVNGTLNPTTPKYGIEVVSGDGVKVLNNKVVSARMGISIDKSNNCTFQYNVIDGGETGLQGYGATLPAKNNQVLGNTFKNGSGRALMLNQNCDGWKIDHNTIDHYGKSGIYMYGTDSTTITNNSITYMCQSSTSGEAAIYWNSDRKTSLVLSGNTLANNNTNYANIPSQFLP